METKFKINDKVYFIKNDRVNFEEITGISYRKSCLGSGVVYEFTDTFPVFAIGPSMNKYEYYFIDEEKLFSTKEELLASL